MIDWRNVAANAFWILGLALALATLDLARWEATSKTEKLTTHLRRYKLPFNFAGCMFAVGLAATSVRDWETLLWGILALLFVVDIVQVKRGKKTGAMET